MDQFQAQAEGLRQRLGPQCRLDRAGRDDPPAAQQQHVGEPGRYLLDVVGDEDQRRGVGSAAMRAEPADEVLAPAEVEPAAGSSSSISSGSVISARAICTRLRSPSDRVPNRRPDRCATPSASSSAPARCASSPSYCSRHRPTMA